MGRNKKTMAIFKRIVTEDEIWKHYFELDCSPWNQNITNPQNQRNSWPNTDLCTMILRGLHAVSAKGQTTEPGTKKCFSISCSQQCNPEDQTTGRSYVTIV
jgi:hypothetical protein